MKPGGAAAAEAAASLPLALGFVGFLAPLLLLLLGADGAAAALLVDAAVEALGLRAAAAAYDLCMWGTDRATTDAAAPAPAAAGVCDTPANACESPPLFRRFFGYQESDNYGNRAEKS